MWPLPVAFALARAGSGQALEGIEQSAEIPLNFSRRFALVLFDEVRDSRLGPQSGKILLHGLVVYVGKKEGRLDLALLHIRNPLSRVGNPRISDAVRPDRLDKIGKLADHAAQVSVEIAVEVRLENEIAGFQML